MLYQIDIMCESQLMKIVSFNINGVRAHLHQIKSIIQIHSPDIIGLQETKVSDESFPFEKIKEMGYEAYVHGQKGHYGVALLSLKPAIRIRKGFMSDEDNVQRRLIIGEFHDLNGVSIDIINAYFPQGDCRDHPTKFPMKAKFYGDLINLIKKRLEVQKNIIVMGDFNIAPEDCDIGIGQTNAKRWIRAGKSAFLPEERAWIKQVFELGLIDSFRHLHKENSELFSWFDYRSRGFEDTPKRGLRIDLILVSKNMESCINQAGIDYISRSMLKPSDHAPIWLSLT